MEQNQLRHINNSNFYLNVKYWHCMEWLLMNALPLFHLLIPGASIIFLILIASQSISINHKRSTKLLLFTNIKMNLFSLFSIWKSKYCRGLFVDWGGGERESHRKNKYVTMWLVFYTYKIINIVLLWIYVRVNFFQFHDVFYGFFNSIRVNTHCSLQQLENIFKSVPCHEDQWLKWGLFR